MTDLFEVHSKQKVVALFGEVLTDVFPDRKVLGGAPFNVARHLRGFGLYPLLITRAGNDEIRDELLAAMSRFGMDVRGVQNDLAHPSGQVTVRLKGKEHSFEIMPDQAYDYIHAGLVHMIALAVRPQLIYFGTLAQRNVTSCRALMTLLRSSKSPRLLDINLREPWYDTHTVEKSLQLADVAKMNEGELSLVASMLCLPGKTAEEHASALIDKFDLQEVLVTCGEQGAWQLAKASNKAIHASGRPTGQAMIDSVGAGDGFAAVLILGMLSHWPAHLILERANAFAAAVCGIRGAIPADQDFYTPFLEKWKICLPPRTTAKTLCTS